MEWEGTLDYLSARAPSFGSPRALITLFLNRTL
jgi:hypothetical protein